MTSRSAYTFPTNVVRFLTGASQSRLAFTSLCLRAGVVDQHRKTGSINTIVVALKGIAEVCEIMNVISTDQAKAIRKIKQLRYYRIPSGRALSCDESQKLLMQKFFCDYHAGFPAECNSKTKDLRTGITFQSLGISFFFNLFNCFVCFCK